MTSNLGAHHINEFYDQGKKCKPQQIKQLVMNELKRMDPSLNELMRLLSLIHWKNLLFIKLLKFN